MNRLTSRWLNRTACSGVSSEIAKSLAPSVPKSLLVLPTAMMSVSYAIERGGVTSCAPDRRSPPDASRDVPGRGRSFLDAVAEVVLGSLGQVVDGITPEIQAAGCDFVEERLPD